MLNKSSRINLICSFALSVVVVLILFVSIALVESFFKQELVISTSSSSMIYDGSELTSKNWDIIDGDLKKGHYITVKFTGSQTDVGKSDNAIKVTIYDKDGNDVSKEYKINYEYGTLNVKKIPLTITSNTIGKIYDGKELTSNVFYIKNYEMIIKGHVIKPVIEGKILESGVVENVITSVAIVDANGDDVSYLYDVETVFGKLYVAKTQGEIPTIPTVEGIKATGEYRSK